MGAFNSINWYLRANEIDEQRNCSDDGAMLIAERHGRGWYCWKDIAQGAKYVEQIHVYYKI